MPGIHDQKASRSFYYNSNGSHLDSRPASNPSRPAGQNGYKNGMEESPSYWVEHLATFAVGREFGLESPTDGLRKLKLMEKSSAIWAQPMVMRLRRNAIVVEDENSEVVESFPLELVSHPTAHISSDQQDVYNNILLFIVAEDRNRPRSANGPFNTAEMHIFQCSRVSANEVLDDIKSYLQGRYQHVKSGRRDTGYSARQPDSYSMASPLGGDVNSYTRTESTEYRSNGELSAYPHVRSDRNQLDRSDSIESSEYFERDVNTLNGCFDEIEKFVAKIQQSALAHREIERQKNLGAKRRPPVSIDPQLEHRAQLPLEAEFVEILQKFKLCFNLLAKLKRHINDPNAPELLHFLFTPLTVILDSSRSGLGAANLGPRVHSPLLTRAAVDLMTNGLTTKETEVWRSLGEYWTIPAEDWNQRRNVPFEPELPGMMTKSGKLPELHQNGHNGSVVNLQMELELEKLAIENERLKLQLAQERQEDRERRLAEEEKRLEEDRRRLLDEREKILMEKERKMAYQSPIQPSPVLVAPPREHFVPISYANHMVDSPPVSAARMFLAELQSRGAHVAQVTYDRVGQNHKELSVAKGEFLEVLNDTKNWWDCRNATGRTGFVPKTILFDFNGGQNGFAPSTSNSSGPPSNSWPSGADSNGQTSPPYAQKEQKTKKRESLEIGLNVPAPPATPLAPLKQSESSGNLTSSQILNGVKLRPTHRSGNEDDNEAGEGQNEAKIKVTQRDDKDDQLLKELKLATMKRSAAQIVGPTLKVDNDRTKSRNISEFSGEADVAEWLEAKGFSMRTLKVLEGQTGATLFSLTKPQLQQFCGKDEGSRLYSQLLIQKNQSGFKTKSAAELTAILQVRKTKADRNGNGNLPVEKLFTSGTTADQQPYDLAL